jgi:hypothetical protein
MAIIHMDGCDSYTAWSDVSVRYPGSSTSGTLNATGGRFGGQCLFPSGSLKVSFPHTGSSAVFVGGSVNFSDTTTNYTVLYLMNTTTGSETTEVSVNIDNGIIRLYRGSQVTLVASSTVLFAPMVWHHMEVKATIADSGGNVEVRMNGVTVINYTGDTRASSSGTAGLDRIIWNGPSSTKGAFDDIYIIDSTGTPNTFVGDCRINSLAPTSDSSVQFTRSTGASNYLCVDEVKQNSDTDYVESSTVGHKDVYGYADLSASVAQVHGVQTLVWMKKTDAASRTVRSLVVSGGVTANGAAAGLNTSYTPIPTIVSTDPATGAQWTASAVNSATAGFEIVS